MGKEIERKFLLKNSKWKEGITAAFFQQGYILINENKALRVRLEGNRAHLNIKSSIDGINRYEYEYEIPVSDAVEMLEKLCIKPIIEKNRYIVYFADKKWEIDEFSGENEGLVVAEIELKDENEYFEKPDWLGEEVTFDKRYYNSSLATHPYKKW